MGDALPMVAPAPALPMDAPAPPVIDEVVINMRPPLADKVWCSCFCCGKRRHCTNTKSRWVGEVSVMMLLLGLDVFLMSRDSSAACASGGALTQAGAVAERLVPVLHLVAWLIVHPPQFGRVGVR
jgi:hypothetical protein